MSLPRLLQVQASIAPGWLRTRGPAFDDFLLGGLPAATGRKMHFTGKTVQKFVDGLIVEENGLDDGLTAMMQLGLIKKA